MAYMPTTNETGTGTRAELPGGVEAFIARGLLVSSSDNAAIVGSSSHHSINVQGTVSAARSAILLGSDPEADRGNTVLVGADGYVATVGSYFAIDLLGSNGRIAVQGGVWSPSFGIRMSGDGEDGKSVLANSGSIRADWAVIERSGDEDFVLHNSGEIVAGYEGAAISSVDGSRDRIFNTGFISGYVDLGGGDDHFDSTNGSMEGRIQGQGGNDQLLMGAGDQRLHGGDGNDVLRGGGDADTFVFDTLPNGKSNVDRILDFSTRDDALEIGNRAFAGLAVGALDVTSFTSGTSGKALDADDRIIYDRDSGRLLFDEDGKGGEDAILFARAGKNLSISHQDFVIFNQFPSLAGEEWEI